MNEISFEDMLTHYQLKLKEVYDEVETLKKQIKSAEISLDSAWKGMAADACRYKLESVNSDITKTQAELSEVLIKLSSIGEQLTEDFTSTV